VDDHRVAERDVLDGCRDVQIGEAAQQGGVGDLQLDAGRLLTEALVHAVAEGEVVVRAALDVEGVRLVERLRVAVVRVRCRR
jgi:hypothetical protein